jgi:hyperosmotically inducible periplasmic protein
MTRFVRSILVCVLGSALSLFAQTTGKQPTAPDNTNVNKNDRDLKRQTADQQKENPSDRGLTQKIRRSITQDKALSSYAKNIKIISQNGTVTLRGPVRSEEEKSAIEAKANEVAGSGHVKSELQVAAKDSGKPIR